MNEHRPRRFSQAIAEGDGISVLVEVRDAAGARAAGAHGADGVVVSEGTLPLGDATELPILWHAASAAAADAAGADACLFAVSDFENWDRLVDEHERARALGLDCVVGVRDEEELQEALEHVDPEILLLVGPPADPDEHPLDHVLELLPDVPAGKLAVAHLAAATRDDVDALERAGMDAVVVTAVDVAALVGAEPPEV